MRHEESKVSRRTLNGRRHGENWKEYKDREEKDWNALVKAMKKIKNVNEDNYSNDVLESYHWIYTEKSNKIFQKLKKECDKNKLPPDVCVGSSELTGGLKYRLGNHGNITLTFAGLERINDEEMPFPSQSQYLLVRNENNEETIGMLLMGDIEAMPDHIDYCDDNGDNGFRIIGYRFQDPIAIKRREIELEKSAKMREFKGYVLYLLAVVGIIGLILVIGSIKHYI